MNFFKKTSAKIRFLYLVLVIFIFTIVAALTFLHTIHSIAALGVPGDMVFGKRHAEFAGPEKYTDAYKKFWETMKSGTPVTKDEKFFLYSGKEIWLQQTYTPIRDKEGVVTRILDIAVDITLEKIQHEELDTVTGKLDAAARELERLIKEQE